MIVAIAVVTPGRAQTCFRACFIETLLLHLFRFREHAVDTNVRAFSMDQARHCMDNLSLSHGWLRNGLH